ncbi:hypothetical protein BTO06_01455 [Tenacibaculum sp. SZ-18]|uniref:hypothetical protein n=1 Tax=Tenacibaculum sp. SZ-18 TaxID=754423 RepID=UPI000C2D4255|nr:hypothetical protein [Tenacibaculum sp. SZ-18]AUC13899.1 hypothetical protein BTO06_01455 [Tenacibaculum sp. SZ-18]
MRNLNKKGIVFFALALITMFGADEVNAQFFKKVKKSLSKTSSSNKSKSSKARADNGGTKGGANFVSKNKMSSRFASGFTNLEMRTKTEKRSGKEYTAYYFGSGKKLAFVLHPRFAKDEYSRGVDGVYSSLFVKEGEEVFHIDELKDVTDQSGTKHSFTPVPSPSKRVLKTPDGVYLVYAFDGGKKIGGKYPYYASSKSNIKGPFVIAAPSAEKFDEWSGEKAMSYVKDFEKRVKLGSFKFMPKEGKLHSPELAKLCEKAIYKKLKQYRNNANLEIRKLVVYSDEWKEKMDRVTDEVTDRQLIAYYVYVNGDDTDINAAKINQKNTDSGFSKELVIEKLYSDKFSKDIPVSLVNKYFKK